MENENKKQIQNATTPQQKSNYGKKYYTVFFTVMIISFLTIFWICNYTKLKEMFQVITLMALSIAIAEYTSRKYLK